MKIPQRINHFELTRGKVQQWNKKFRPTPWTQHRRSPLLIHREGLGIRNRSIRGGLKSRTGTRKSKVLKEGRPKGEEKGFALRKLNIWGGGVMKEEPGARALVKTRLFGSGEGEGKALLKRSQLEGSEHLKNNGHEVYDWSIVVVMGESSSIRP